MAAPAATRPRWWPPASVPHVTVVDRDGLGGACVLTDCVPSKTLISTAGFVTNRASGDDSASAWPTPAWTSPPPNRRILDLAAAQSSDIAARLTGDGVRIVRGTGTLLGAGAVRALGRGRDGRGPRRRGRPAGDRSTPRTMPTAQPDGERILTWQQIYSLAELPEQLVVVGSGVTGAEFAQRTSVSAAQVTLVSSRDRVLPGEDADAADGHRGDLRAARHDGPRPVPHGRCVERTADGVVVTLDRRPHRRGLARPADRRLRPATAGIGLAEIGIALDDGGSHRGRRGVAHLGAAASTPPATAPAC